MRRIGTLSFDELVTHDRKSGWAYQFYNLHTYEMILVENDALGTAQEVGRRYTPGELPIEGEKRPV